MRRNFGRTFTFIKRYDSIGLSKIFRAERSADTALGRKNMTRKQIQMAIPGSDPMNSKENPRASTNLIMLISGIVVIYSLIAFLIFWRVGFLPIVEDVVFSTPDSQGYRVYADFFAGNAPVPSTSLVSLRPFVFPLYLSLYHYIGITGFFIIQWLLSLVTIVMTFTTIQIITKSRWWGLLGVVAIVLHPTFSFISLHALPGSLSLALLSLVVYQISQFLRSGRQRHLFLSCFFLSLAVCAKPTYLPFLVLWIFFAGYCLLKSPIRSLRAAIAVPLSLSPLIVQFMLTFALTGNAVFSTAGSSNFEGRFFPAVYGFSQKEDFVSYRSSEAMDAKSYYPKLQDKVVFVLTHPYATVKTVTYLLKHNLITSSLFTRYPQNLVTNRQLSHVLRKVSKSINTAMVPIHLLGLLATFVLVLSRDPDSYLLFFLTCLVTSVIVFSVLTYWQGDRLIIAALPAWTVLYALIGSKIVELTNFSSLTRRFSGRVKGARR